MYPLFFALCLLFCRIGIPLEHNAILHLELNALHGKRIVLNDQSIWEIHPNDLSISQLWLFPAPLQISLQGEEPYPYIMTNLQSHTQIRARLLEDKP